MILKPSGEIQLRYGYIADTQGDPTVGISRGDGLRYQSVSGYDGSAIGSNAQTVVLTRVASTTPPSISGHTVAPVTFSPNGDGQAETTTYSASFNRFVNWSLAINNASGTTVRTFTGSGESMSQVWDGTEAGGAPAPTGAYDGILTATDIDSLASTVSTGVFLDRTAPGISGFAASPDPFSPNADATSDSQTISATLSDPTGPISWTLSIMSGSTTHRTFAGTSGSVSQVWDGENTAGSVLASGAYTALLTATDAENNTGSSSIPVTIDIDAPSFSNLSASPASISPNGDSSQDSTTLSATIADASAINWTIEVSSAAGGPVLRAFTGAGASPSAVWDGKDSSGTLLSDGNYRFQVTASDGQNLSAQSSLVPVTIDTQAPAVSGYQAAPSPFNVASTFSATVDDASASTAALTIRDGQGSTVRTLTSSFGSGVVLWTESWDAKDGTGAFVADGAYDGSLSVTDAAGNTTTGSTSVAVDRSPPMVTGLSSSLSSFSPNGDGFQDTATFTGTISDAATFNWTMVVKDTQSQQTVRTFSGSTGSVSQLWDGKNASGVTVPDGSYTATLTATDTAGNQGTNSVPVVVDTGYSQVIAADSPALYYRLGESAGTVASDSSGNGRIGLYGTCQSF